MQEKISNLTEQLTSSEQEELYALIKDKYSVEFKPLVEKIIEVIVEIFGIDVDNITPSTKLDDLGISGIDLIGLLLVLEEKFKMNADDNGDDNPATVGDILNLFTKRGD